MAGRRKPGDERRTWGGGRAGAGRRPRHGGVGGDHSPRPSVNPKHPLLITNRVMPDVDLDEAEAWEAIEAAVTEANEATAGFEVERISAEGPDLLLLVRARNKSSLTKGMQGLSIRVARGLNRVLDREGRVFMDRYRAQPLKTRAAVKTALERF